MVVCLWSCPRTISTALMYSFSQRNDTIVYDEVLYPYYLKVTGKEHPGRNEILTSMDSNSSSVIENLILQNTDNVHFHKLMAHFLIDIDLSFLLQVKNILLIRSPKFIISSYSKVIDKISIDDIGIKKQYDLYHYLNQYKRKPIVIDASHLIDNPKKILKFLCYNLGVKFYSSMLRWDRGPIKEDGIWAKYWYTNVHNSTNFEKTKNEVDIKPMYKDLLNESQRYYEFLYSKISYD